MQTQARFALGQRYIAAGAGEGFYSVDQVPGNALGAYLDGATVEVFCNAQDATGDTMNGGEIIVHGSSGDATGYAMRGGSIYIERDAGYRCGIHMKEYQQKVPAIVIGGRCGSFLGEYQAGGTIVVLGLNRGEKRIVGNFPCTGMHGGKVYLRGDCQGISFPGQVTAAPAGEEELEEISRIVSEYCSLFGVDFQQVMGAPFTVVTPDSKNPYRQMYVAN